MAAEALPHMDDLFRIALRMTGDRTRAEDALQETFLQALEILPINSARHQL